MKSKSRFITVCAILSALSVVMLYIASVIPSGQIGFIAAASLFGIAAVIETGGKGGLAVFIVSALIGILILPSKTAILFYALFFGHYPIVKSLAERSKSRVAEWLIKLVTANIALTVMVVFFIKSFFEYISFSENLFLIYLIFNIIFLIFDIGVSKAVVFYIEKISKRIK